MLIKKYLGQTMAEMEFVTRQQLDEALQRQKQIMSEKILHERVQRVRLVTEARLSKDTDVAPLLGQILTEMGLVTKEQLKQALKEQEKSFEACMSLENEKLGIAIEIGSLVNSTLNLAEVLFLIMKHVNRVTNSVASTLMLVDEKTGELVFSVPTGPKTDRLIDIRIPPGEGIAGWVAEQEQPVLVPNVKEDTRFYPKIDEISGFETKSILCIPLKAKTKLIGVLEVINKLDGSCFAEEDELLLSMFGYQAAMAIENARLYGELLDQLEESKRAEEALRESEEKYHDLYKLMRLIADNVPDLIWAKDMDDRFIFANQAICDKLLMCGNPDKAVDKTDMFFAEQERNAGHEHSFGEICVNSDAVTKERKAPGRFLEEGLVRNEYLVLDVHKAPFLNEDGEMIGTVGCGRDITQEKETERTLRESEVKYKILTENSITGVFIHQNGRFVFVNDRFAEIHGYTPDELLGEEYLALIHADEKETVAQRVSKRLKKEPVTQRYEVKRLKKDGTTVWCEMMAARIEYQGRPAVMGNLIDITERKRAEEKILRQSRVLDGINKVFRETLICESEGKVAGICLSVAEELTGSKFGFIGELNSAGLFDTIAISNPGWDACKMLDSEATRLIKNMKISGIYGSVLRDEKPHIVNEPASHPDRTGTPKGHPPITSFLGVPLKHGGRTMGMIGLANKESGYDLADQQAIEALSISFIEALNRKRSEVALSESEEKYRSLVESTEDSIYLIDENLRYLFANEKHLSRFSLSTDRIIGRKYEEFHSKEETKDFTEKIHKVFETGKSLSYEYQSEKDGKCFIRTLSPVKEKDGRTMSVTVISKDITDRRQVEEALKFSNEELLKESNQRKILSKRLIDLLEKDRHEIAMELHDHIGQVLTSLKINLEMIGSQLKPTKTELASQIKAAEQTAIQVLKDIKSISHGLMPSILDALGLESSLRELFNEIQKGTDIQVHFFSRNVPQRFAREKELAVYRIAQEALTNVLKHARAKNAHANLVKKGDMLSLSVEDDGVGFKQDKAMKISKGRGPLGLFIMRERAIQLGGGLHIESQPGKGTLVLAEIPL